MEWLSKYFYVWIPGILFNVVNLMNIIILIIKLYICIITTLSRKLRSYCTYILSHEAAINFWYYSYFFEISIFSSFFIFFTTIIESTGPDQICWATTSVNGVSFAVLERMYVTYEVKWGVPTVTQVDLFGRHPGRGFLLLESVTESDWVSQWNQIFLLWSISYSPRRGERSEDDEERGRMKDEGGRTVCYFSLSNSIILHIFLFLCIFIFVDSLSYIFLFFISCSILTVLSPSWSYFFCRNVVINLSDIFSRYFWEPINIF